MTTTIFEITNYEDYKVETQAIPSIGVIVVSQKYYVKGEVALQIDAHFENRQSLSSPKVPFKFIIHEKGDIIKMKTVES